MDGDDEGFAPAPYAFAGDWHGNLPWVRPLLAGLASSGVSKVYQLGDFGLWPGAAGKKYLDGIADVLAEHDMTLYVILGNHDDYSQHEKMKRVADGWLQLRTARYGRIFFAPRQHAWIEDGLRFASLCGAGSIDRNLRVEGETWWRQEEITEADRDNLIAMLDDLGWDSVDVFLSHEAPMNVQMGSWAAAARPYWFDHVTEYYCQHQRVLLGEAVDRAAPAWLLHGHWHRRHRTLMEGVNSHDVPYLCTVIGLAEDGKGDNSWQPGAGELSRL